MFSLKLYRYCILCKVCLDCWERCNISETAGWQLLYKTISLYHNYSELIILQYPLPVLNLQYIVPSQMLRVHNRCVCGNQGKGVPDVNSRLMVRKLWDTLHIPIFALVDADPYGTLLCCPLHIPHLLERSWISFYLNTNCRVACVTKAESICTCPKQHVS